MTNDPSSKACGHGFDFSVPQLAGVLIPIVLGFALLIGLLQALAAFKWLPTARPVQGFDEVLLSHRHTMLRADHPAEIIVIGDSSSAVNIEAPLLSRLLPAEPRVLNQGMFMGIDMAIYGQAAGNFIKHHPGQVKLVVLLTTAEQLPNTRMSPYHESYWHGLFEGDDTGKPRSPASAWLAMDVARLRLANHVVPFAVHGQSGWFYGHPLFLRDHLPRHDGSTVDRGWFNRSGREDLSHWRINPDRAREAAKLRDAIPRDVTLAFGIAPMPEGYVGPEFRDQRDALMREFNEWLQADILLTNLPARLPNGYCASTVHLNQRGQEAFTRLLAEELERLGALGR
ncbi:MAG TPA: hypothetical protein DCY13_02400 [Verrucomicrobiales bacterium]|nr:hypothetical protein [Verrucomicrobiales bacterium]